MGNVDSRTRHAYLIMAHADPVMLVTLLELLDHPQNEIYLHIDRKNNTINTDELHKILKHSSIHIFKKYKVFWADYSQVECEFFLLKEATRKKYMYYHLLSGADLPIKTQSEIHYFFSKNQGKEFLQFGSTTIPKHITEWYSYFYILQRYLHLTKSKYLNKFIKLTQLVIIRLQKSLFINRNREGIRFQKGANWFSITHNFATYAIQQESWIKKSLSFTQSPDEIFMQTILINSEFCRNLYDNRMNDNYRACMRYIDWKRGNPYIFKFEDFDTLMNSEFLFARKFNSEIDFMIIKKISNYLESISK